MLDYRILKTNQINRLERKEQLQSLTSRQFTLSLHYMSNYLEIRFQKSFVGGMHLYIPYFMSLPMFKAIFRTCSRKPKILLTPNHTEGSQEGREHLLVPFKRVPRVLYSPTPR